MVSKRRNNNGVLKIGQNKKHKGTVEGERLIHPFLSLDEMQKYLDLIIESPKHYNSLVKLLQSLDSIILILGEKAKTEDEFTLISRTLIVTLFKIFKHLLSNRSLRVTRNQSEDKKTVSKWLKCKYDDFKSKMFKIWYIDNDDEGLNTLKIDILDVLMKFLKLESEYLAPTIAENFFPTLSYQEIIAHLLVNGDNKNIQRSDSTINDFLILEFQDSYFSRFWDLRYYFFNELIPIIRSLSTSDDDHESIIQKKRLIFSKIITLVKPISMYDKKTEEDISSVQLFTNNTPVKTISNFSQFRITYEKTWIDMMNFPLDNYQYKAVLFILHKRIIPFCNNPQKLMDFLCDAYTTGIRTKDISISILALNGLWELMKSHNLEYPDFYTNLYAILTPDLLHLNYKSRFFRLLDLFMSSTHLPASIVASFIKRLARLSLTAPPAGIICVIPFLYNLFKRHPTCMLLVHTTTTAIEDENYIDPFDETETDPSKTEALGSSIWELHCMINHYHPNVSSLAKIFTQHFNKYSYNMEDFLDWSYAKLLDSETKKRFKGDLGLEFEKWDKLYGDDGYLQDYAF